MTLICCIGNVVVPDRQFHRISACIYWKFHSPWECLLLVRFTIPFYGNVWPPEIQNPGAFTKQSWHSYDKTVSSNKISTFSCFTLDLTSNNCIFNVNISALTCFLSFLILEEAIHWLLHLFTFSFIIWWNVSWINLETSWSMQIVCLQALAM